MGFDIHKYSHTTLNSRAHGKQTDPNYPNYPNYPNSLNYPNCLGLFQDISLPSNYDPSSSNMCLGVTLHWTVLRVTHYKWCLT